MSTTHDRINPERMPLAAAQVSYLAGVAETAIRLGDPASEDSVLYAFGVTPVPAGIDAYAEPTAQEIAAVAALVRAAQEIAR